MAEPSSQYNFPQQRIENPAPIKIFNPSRDFFNALDETKEQFPDISTQFNLNYVRAGRMTQQQESSLAEYLAAFSLRKQLNEEERRQRSNTRFVFLSPRQVHDAFKQLNFASYIPETPILIDGKAQAIDCDTIPDSLGFSVEVSRKNEWLIENGSGLIDVHLSIIQETKAHYHNRLPFDEKFTKVRRQREISANIVDAFRMLGFEDATELTRFRSSLKRALSTILGVNGSRISLHLADEIEHICAVVCRDCDINYSYDNSISSLPVIRNHSVLFYQRQPLTEFCGSKRYKDATNKTLHIHRR